MSRKKKNSLSDDVENILRQLVGKENLTLVALVAEGDRHVTILRGRGDILSELVRATLAHPENEEVEAFSNILLCGLGAAMLDNDKLYGLADHVMCKVAEMRVRDKMQGGMPS